MLRSLPVRRPLLPAPPGRRQLTAGRPLRAQVPPAPKPREKVVIPGLDRVTYGDRMHYVPGLASPQHPRWEPTHRDPRHYRSPPAQDMADQRENTCYVFSQRSNVLEGVRQVLWLTKSKLYAGLPSQLLSFAQDPANQIPEQDERVQTAIRHARFWDTSQERPRRQHYCSTLLFNLIHLCGSLQSRFPQLGNRMLAEKYSLSCCWPRGEDVFQVRGQNGLLLSSATPLPVLSGKQEVEETTADIMETFYPVAPTIDLQRVNIYKTHNSTGFKEDYPYAHAHTLYFLEAGDGSWKLRPEQARAKMLMFAFANALVRAYRQHGTQPCVLEQPITVQAVGTNGRMFQFLVFQLNTTDLQTDHGVKNQVWLEEDVLLYDYAKVRPLIKKKQVQVPSGLSGYQPETFNKFLSLYLHGAVC